MKPFPVVPEECFADSVGSATIFQQIRGYFCISLMAAFKLTYFYSERNNVFLKIFGHFNLAMFISYDQ
jgi:hypothetical protein